MAFPYPYQTYQPTYYPQPVPDQLAQLRQQQMQPQMMQGSPSMMPQPTQLPPPQSSIPGNGINWVGSKAEADNWPISPGCAVALWDSNNPVIYLRQADSTGKPSTKVYDLVERAASNMPPQPATSQIDLSQVVTWDKLEDYLTERLKKPSKQSKQKEEADNG